MKSKIKIFLMLVFLLGSFVSFSQGNKDKVEEMRMTFITKKLELSSDESEKFWPIYNECNDKIKALKKNWRQALRKAPENLTEKEAEELYQLDIKTRQAEAELHKTYGDKLKAIVGAKKMVMLRGAEEEFKQKVLESIKGN
jgi:hypothetical protein